MVSLRLFLCMVIVSSIGCDSESKKDQPPGAPAAIADAAAPPILDGGRRVPNDAGTAPPTESVHFIVIGDTGEGNEAQFAVAEAIKDRCDLDRCDFVILTGDNIYADGVVSVDDPQWREKFEEPYRNLNLPFYAVLGNHDYGGQLLFLDVPGIGNEWEKGRVEVEYTTVSTKWTMPSTHYAFTRGPVGFIMLDTNSLLWDHVEHGDQAEWYPMALTEVGGAEWVFAVGHHPYRSNGQHGNAGAYDAPEFAGITVPIGIPIQNGEYLRDFFDEHICGTVDAYFCGHDHNRQWLHDPEVLCGTEMIISGAGAKTTPIQDRGNHARFEEGTTPGFFFGMVEGNRFTGQFYDHDGVLQFEHTTIH